MELETFRDSVVENKPTVVSIMDGYRAMDIAHQILTRIKNNVLAT
jgi:hypothetical protein